MPRLGRLSMATTLLAALTLCSLTAQAQVVERLQPERNAAQRADDRDRERADQRDGAGDRRVEITPQLLPPDRDHDRWFLGVEVEYRDYGAQVTRRRA